MVKNYVYILRCKDNSLYTGWTTNIERRLKEHNSGKGAKYTKGRRPCKLVYYELLPDKSSALKREYEIKQLKKTEKEKLVLSFPTPS